MKRITFFHSIKILVGGLAVVATLFQACNEEKFSLNTIPNADFEIQSGSDANTVVFVNKTPGASIAYWTVPATGQKAEGNSASLRFTFAGTYDVDLLVVTQGGTTTVTKQVNITQSDPTACDPDKALGFIAGCTQKTWKLNPAAGAYMVGPGANNGTWWSSTASDVTSRSCEFNDEYTFVFDAQGTFVYDNKGDFYSDGYLGTGSDTCEPNSNLPTAQQPWASGTFSFSVTESGGVNNLGQLRLNGAGAHIGLQKVHNGGETTSGPAGNSIIYDILEMNQNVGGQGYDILKVGVNIGGEAWWTFTLRSN